MAGRNAQRTPLSTTELEQALTCAIAGLCEGEVVSYGDVAGRAGRPDAPRAVGAFLSKSILTLPWWRVVYADGKLAPSQPDVQQARLEAEGVVVRNGKVVSAKFGRFAK